MSAGPERYSLDECVRIGLKKSQAARRAALSVDGARAATKSMRGRFLPLVRMEANILRWDSPIEVSFAPPGGPPSDAIQIRGNTTAQISATALQPLSGLYTVYQGYRAAIAGEEAARHKETANRNQVALNIADAYYQALKVQRLSEIATLSVEQLEAHTARARSFFGNGVIGKNQLLEAQVRLAQARAKLSEVNGGLLFARSALAFHMGLPANEPIIPAPIDVQRLPIFPGQVQNASLSDRPDLRAAESRIEQADAGVGIAFSKLFPEVLATASYQHVEGQALAAKNQFFAGVLLSWNVWEWGTTYYTSQQAEVTKALAASGRAQLEEGARLELLKAEVDLNTAKERIAVAEKAVDQADENLRIEQRRFEASSATSTDVLDAQALAARTRVTHVTARYDYLRAVAAYRKALGVTPVPKVSKENK